MKINYPDSFIKKILEESNTIAIVGASSKEDRDSYKVMKYLLQKFILHIDQQKVVHHYHLHYMKIVHQL